VTQPGDAKEDELGEWVEDLNGLQDEVAAAADAAASSAAHAVGAARAIDEISKAREAEAEPSVPTGISPVNADEEFDDLLNLDDPDGAMPSVLTRLALIALGSAAATVLVSFLLIATLPRGTLFDVLVLITWLSVGVLSVGGLAMLAAGGIAKVIGSRNRTSD